MLPRWQDGGNENAGNVTLNANVVGITPQLRNTPQSNITASTERGVQGRITISNLVLDPTRGLVELPTTVVDASNLIARQCVARSDTAEERSRFVITGRGGLPRAPDDVRGRDEVLTDWVTLESSDSSRAVDLHRSEVAPSIAPSSSALLPSAIVEAQGWVRSEDGKVELVAQVPDPVPSDLMFSNIGCNSPERSHLSQFHNDG